MNTEYYIINKNICLDSNQWSILIGGIGVFLTLFGFIVAFRIYRRQKLDDATDAFVFFQAFLPILKDSIIDTIEHLNQFHTSLNDPNDNFITPIFNSSLSDRFLSRINIVDLNRHYLLCKKSKYDTFKNFITNSNFIGDYLNYFTTEIDFFRQHYKEKEQIYSDWQLLRSNKFFTSVYDKDENRQYKTFYANWVEELSRDNEVFEFNKEGFPQSVISRKLLVEKHINKLRYEIFPFIPQSEKANEINLIANKIVMAYEDITAFKLRMSSSISKDIDKFNEILDEVNTLLK
ncbi:hypothetical protein [Flavobacterium sp.]|uniref:hypothetical protein n=1 Tax=Flavobacterium sp. TaxID=239 RepID=UPI00286B0470|nr:hypothetical protein [Flavobacterium sp.]